MPSEPSPAAPRETGLVQRLRASWAGLGDARTDTLVVGYSGGADSLALLGAAASLARTGAFRLIAVHVDHGVRERSGLDAALCADVCARLGVPLVVKAVASEALARHAGVGVEEALRRERYRAFAEVSGAHGSAVVATAHHEQDQAETVLLHMLRGSGIRGASGMRAVADLHVPWWDEPTAARAVTVWRPLLGEAREDVRAFALSLGLPVANDASNEDVAFRRNAIRHEVLPVLERVSPGATGNLARFARLAGEDSDYLDGLARSALASVRLDRGLDRVAVLALDGPIQRRVVQAWLVEHGPAGLEVPLNRLEEVLQVASRPGADRRVEIGQGLAVLVTRETFEVSAGE